LLAAGLLARARDELLLTEGDLAASVAELFAREDAAATHWQRVAVAVAPGSRLLVVTGGPGTGKTATVVRLLLMLLRHAQACRLPAHPTIALAAPTGKAAQRLAQAIANGKEQLREQFSPASEFRNLLDRIPHAAAGTLHRLLGYRPRDNTFTRC